MISVLHVVESFGGGTASAIEQYVRSTPEICHSILYSIRDDSPGEKSVLALMHDVHELPRGRLSAVRAVRSIAQRHRVNAIHAHSSLAGVYSRLAVSCREIPILYTAHCFAFERRDKDFVTRWFLRAIESALSANTTLYVACSEHEGALSGGFAMKRPVIVVPNIASPFMNSSNRVDTSSESLRVVTTGRVGRQKDPAFFARVVDAIRVRVPHVEAVWIGGGDPDLSAALVQSGIRITGWVTKTEVAELLANSDLYVHTAAWEGFPIAILEAASFDLPIAARAIEALGQLSARMGSPDAEQLGSLCADLLLNTNLRDSNRAEWKGKLLPNSALGQRSALLDAYNSAAMASAGDR